MTDYTELKRLAEAQPVKEWSRDSGRQPSMRGRELMFCVEGPEGVSDYEDWGFTRSAASYIAAASPSTILALIAEIEALKGPHDWLAEDLIKELVDNAQSFQENACEEGEDPFVVVLLAAASRIRRQEANIDQLKAGFKNFHRSLCERFGYFHDEADWQRDQDSLEEHIATQFSHVNAENAALRGQVEALQRGAGKLQEENEALRLKVTP